jgi:hypothetical protein
MLKQNSNFSRGCSSAESCSTPLKASKLSLGPRWSVIWTTLLIIDLTFSIVPILARALMPRERVITDHAQSIFKGQYDSLHYFMLWIGNGCRMANFILLWSFEDDTTQDEWYHAKSDQDCFSRPHIQRHCT